MTLLGSVALAVPLAAQTVAITGGRVVVGDGSEPIENGTVVIRNGRVVAAGANVSVPGDAERIDAAGRWVTPGVIAGLSRLGLAEVDAVDDTNDVRANGTPFSAAIDVAPAINPRATAIAVSRAAGITRAIVAPETGRSIFAGQGAVIDLADDMQPITRARAFQYVEFGELGAQEAGGSRPAAHALIRNALREAQDISPERIDGGGASSRQPNASEQQDLPLEEVPDARLGRNTQDRAEDVLLTRFDARALVPVVTGRQPMFVRAERASDILQAIALRREFPRLRMVLVGATEGWTVAREIAAAGIPVIANALTDLPASFEQLAATQSNVGRLRAAGVRVALGTLNEDETRQVRVTTQNAGNLVALNNVPGASGLPYGEAVAAITSRPAEILGLGSELGSLRAGRRADVVIWSGDPLEVTSNAERVWIDGVEQPLTNHQTKLRDRYRSLDESRRPRGYER